MDHFSIFWPICMNCVTNNNSTQCQWLYKLTQFQRTIASRAFLSLSFYRAALGRVCMKLVVVMGITWIADVLSWAHNVWITQSNAHNTQTIDVHSFSHGVRYYFFYIMDSINALQGVLIFLVVASQPQVNKPFIRLLWFSFFFLHVYFCLLNSSCMAAASRFIFCYLDRL